MEKKVSLLWNHKELLIFFEEIRNFQDIFINKGSSNDKRKKYFQSKLLNIFRNYYLFFLIRVLSFWVFDFILDGIKVETPRFFCYFVLRDLQH